MRKYALLAALAGAIFATTVALPNRADAMTFSNPAGVLSAAAAVDVAQPEQVRWCGWRGCWGWGRRAWWGPRPYYYGYYTPYPYYAYSYYPYPYWGWGYRRWWW